MSNEKGDLLLRDPFVLDPPFLHLLREWLSFTRKLFSVSFHLFDILHSESGLSQSLGPPFLVKYNQGGIEVIYTR